MPAFASLEEATQSSTLAWIQVSSENLFRKLISYFTINEFDIARTLWVTVSSSVFWTSRVAGKLTNTTIQIHGGEINSTIKAAADTTR